MQKVFKNVSKTPQNIISIMFSEMFRQHFKHVVVLLGTVDMVKYVICRSWSIIFYSGVMRINIYSVQRQTAVTVSIKRKQLQLFTFTLHKWLYTAHPSHSWVDIGLPNYYVGFFVFFIDLKLELPTKFPALKDKYFHFLKDIPSKLNYLMEEASTILIN